MKTPRARRELAKRPKEVSDIGDMKPRRDSGLPPPPSNTDMNIVRHVQANTSVDEEGFLSPLQRSDT